VSIKYNFSELYLLPQMRPFTNNFFDLTTSNEAAQVRRRQETAPVLIKQKIKRKKNDYLVF